MSKTKSKQSIQQGPNTRSTVCLADEQQTTAASLLGEDAASVGSLTMQQLTEGLDKQRCWLKEDMSTLIKDSIRPVQSSVDMLREQFETFKTKLDHTEALAGENFEKLTQAENAIQILQQQNKSLMDRVDTLENMSRRPNLRITGIPEGSESGQDSVAFMSELLRECMGADVFPKPPTLERVHRTPGGPPQPRTDLQHQSPRVMLVRFHYFQEKEAALRWSRQNELKYKGAVLRVYPDLSSALAKRRSAFKQVKQALYEKKIPFHLIYPARLRVRFEEETITFETPEDASVWMNRRNK